MNDIPEGYKYIRCDQYSPEAFLELYRSKEMRKVCQEYIQAHPKEIYTTDDQIAIHGLVRDRRANSLQLGFGRTTTKRYKRDEE